MLVRSWWTGRPQKSEKVIGTVSAAATVRAAPVAAAAPAKPISQFEHPVAKKTILTDKTVSTISHIALIAWVVVILSLIHI